MSPYISVPLTIAGTGGFIYLWTRLIDALAASVWDRFSKEFPDSEPILPKRDYKRVDMRIGNSELGGLLDVTIIDTGLRVFPRFNRSSIFIPWSQVESIASGLVVVRYVPPIHLMLPFDAFERIRACAPNVHYDQPEVESFIDVIRRQSKA